MILRLTPRASVADRQQIGSVPVMVDDKPVGGDGGTLLWHALEAGTTRLELVDRLASEYEVDRAQAAASTDRYLRQLRRRGLLLES